MKPHELFGVVVRTIGLLLVMSSAWSLFWALLILIGGGHASTILLFIYGIPFLLVGIWFLRGAPQIVALAYHKRE